MTWDYDAWAIWYGKDMSRLQCCLTCMKVRLLWVWENIGNNFSVNTRTLSQVRWWWRVEWTTYVVAIHCTRHSTQYSIGWWHGANVQTQSQEMDGLSHGHLKTASWLLTSGCDCFSACTMKLVLKKLVQAIWLNLDQWMPMTDVAR